MHRFTFGKETFLKLREVWKTDYDDEGYDFPFIESWFWRRTGGELTVISSGTYLATFRDIQSAVEFKLRWL